MTFSEVLKASVESMWSALKSGSCSSKAAWIEEVVVVVLVVVVKKERISKKTLEYLPLAFKARCINSFHFVISCRKEDLLLHFILLCIWSWSLSFRSVVLCVRFLGGKLGLRLYCSFLSSIVRKVFREGEMVRYLPGVVALWNYFEDCLFKWYFRQY